MLRSGRRLWGGFIVFFVRLLREYLVFVNGTELFDECRWNITAVCFVQTEDLKCTCKGEKDHAGRDENSNVVMPESESTTCVSTLLILDFVVKSIAGALCRGRGLRHAFSVVWRRKPQKTVFISLDHLADRHAVRQREYGGVLQQTLWYLQ